MTSFWRILSIAWDVNMEPPKNQNCQVLLEPQTEYEFSVLTVWLFLSVLFIVIFCLVTSPHIWNLLSLDLSVLLWWLYMELLAVNTDERAADALQLARLRHCLLRFKGCHSCLSGREIIHLHSLAVTPRCHVALSMDSNACQFVMRPNIKCTSPLACYKVQCVKSLCLVSTEPRCSV